jgi:histidyl-tRNA synthetase
MSENKKAEKIVGVKGMNDLLPTESPLWELFENTAQSVLQSYGFQKIVTPIIEDTALFKRAIGAVTDIVHRCDERRPADLAP